MKLITDFISAYGVEIMMAIITFVACVATAVVVLCRRAGAGQ